jgi:hypothetical protein
LNSRDGAERSFSSTRAKDHPVAPSMNAGPHYRQPTASITKPGTKPIKIVSPVDLNTQWFMVVISQHHRLVGPPQVRAADE